MQFLIPNIKSMALAAVDIDTEEDYKNLLRIAQTSDA